VTRTVRTVLQVNTRDSRGGAEQVALNLHHAFTRRGVRSYLAVGDRSSEDPAVIPLTMSEGRPAWYRGWRTFADRAGGTKRVFDELRGAESFHYPATYRLPTLAPGVPDILHAHNLHGGYFDLRALPWLSERLPVVLSLHDAWLLSGHCSHSFDCDRWRTGCGNCPDLSIYPAIRRDRTAQNWARKQGIYAGSRLFVATPCRWLMDRVDASMLDPAIIERRVIPNGVDLSVFRPADRSAARAALGIPAHSRVLLFVASGVRHNPFKDYERLRAAVGRIAEQTGDDVLFLALGESSPPERVGRAQIRFVPFEAAQSRVAQYYHAADLYLHAARADTFPNSVLEALACGTPVIATAVGGIPEQVRSVDPVPAAGPARIPAAPEPTGVLVGPEDAIAISDAALRLLADDELRGRVGENAVHDARRRFDLELQCDTWLDWYESILAQWKSAFHRP
jgi:glycosyltransferase involved in cell wall biosynthesis